MKFDEAFKEPCFFEPEGVYVSRRAYTREEAAVLIRKTWVDCWGRDMEVKVRDLEASWVRFGPTGFMEGELGKMAWMVVDEGTPGSQPVWVHRKPWEIENSRQVGG